MFGQRPLMPREFMHSKECLAQAMISAIQNLRDEDSQTDFGFRAEMQDNTALQMADGYLADGLQECRCPSELRDAVLEAPAECECGDYHAADDDHTDFSCTQVPTKSFGNVAWLCEHCANAVVVVTWS